MLDVTKNILLTFKGNCMNFSLELLLCYFKSPSDLKTASQNRSDPFGSPCMYSFYIVFENSIKYKWVEQLLSPYFWKGFSFEQELFFKLKGKLNLNFFGGHSTKFFLYYSI